MKENKKHISIISASGIFYINVSDDYHMSNELKSFSSYASCSTILKVIIDTATAIKPDIDASELIPIIREKITDIFDEINTSSNCNYYVWLDGISILHIRDCICLNPEDIIAPSEDSKENYLDTLEIEMPLQFGPDIDVISPEICIFKRNSVSFIYENE